MVEVGEEMKHRDAWVAMMFMAWSIGWRFVFFEKKKLSALLESTGAKRWIHCGLNQARIKLLDQHNASV